jgi:hypothetical protein
MKKGNKNIIWFIVIGAVLLLAFKKPTTTATTLIPIDLPGSTPDNNVYSQVGTNIVDANGNIVYTYDTSGIGMMVVSQNGLQLYVEYDNNKYGYVQQSQITQ